MNWIAFFLVFCTLMLITAMVEGYAVYMGGPQLSKKSKFWYTITILAIAFVFGAAWKGLFG